MRCRAQSPGRSSIFTIFRKTVRRAVSRPKPSVERLVDQLVLLAAPLLAERVAELVTERYGEVAPLLDAAGAARYLGTEAETDRRWVREGRIGAIRLGDGPKARLRFDPKALRDELFTPPITDE
jgi:excisionase family DNA binding protein